MKFQKTRERKRRIVAVVMVLALAEGAMATIVEVSAATDKPMYLLGEEVTVSVTAYNPNPEPVELVFGGFEATYLMDDVFDWRQGKAAGLGIRYLTIDPYDSYTRDLIHGEEEMDLYPLSIGTHYIVGEFLDYGYSAQVEFEVVPEPASVFLLTLGASIIRFTKSKNS